MVEARIVHDDSQASAPVEPMMACNGQPPSCLSEDAAEVAVHDDSQASAPTEPMMACDGQPPPSVSEDAAEVADTVDAALEAVRVSARNRGLSVRRIFRLGREGAFLIVSSGSVVDFAGDAIVNAANQELLAGGGVDGAVARAGGPALADARRAVPFVQGFTRCPVGDARITTGGDLKAKRCIHAVGPNYNVEMYTKTVEQCDNLLFSAYTAAMGSARDEGLNTIAFSLLSSGIFKGVRSLREVIAIGVRGINDAVYASLQEVHMVAFTDDQLSEMEIACEEVLGGGFAPTCLPAGTKVVAQLDSSQYSLGASSACTLMTVEAALRICSLGRVLSDPELALCVNAAAAYDCDLHLAADDVIEHCQRYSKLLQVVHRCEGEPFQEFDALTSRMEHMCLAGHQSLAAVVTKSPETVLVTCTSEAANGVTWHVFDSHARQLHAGAAVVALASRSALAAYLHDLWPMPFIAGLDEGQAFMLHCFDACVLALKDEALRDGSTSEAILNGPIDVASLKVAISMRELEKLRQENADLRRKNGELERTVANERRRAFDAEDSLDALRGRRGLSGFSGVSGFGGCPCGRPNCKNRRPQSRMGDGWATAGGTTSSYDADLEYALKLSASMQ